MTRSLQDPKGAPLSGAGPCALGARGPAGAELGGPRPGPGPLRRGVVGRDPLAGVGDLEPEGHRREKHFPGTPAAGGDPKYTAWRQAGIAEDRDPGPRGVSLREEGL